MDTFVEDNKSLRMGAYGNMPEASMSNNDIYVSTTGSDSIGNGTIGNPYATIQKGINMVANGGFVIVAGGLYNERFSFTTGHKGFTLTSTGSSVISGQNLGRVFYFYFVSNSITINNFTIQDGKATDGGGAYISYSNDISFVNCEFEDNDAYSSITQCRGGAVYIHNCSPSFSNCNFDNNQVSGTTSNYGGAIYTNNASATIDHCTIGTNSAYNNSLSDEIYTYGSSVPTYTNCAIRGWYQDAPFVNGNYMDYSSIGPSGNNNSGD